MAVTDAEAARLLVAFEALGWQPGAPADFASVDERGRPLLYRRVGDLAIVYWRSQVRRRVVIVEIKRMEA